jgi:hypothetical protein
MRLSCRVLSVFLFSAAKAMAQTAHSPSSYDPRVTFAPLAPPNPVNADRSGKGAPGPGFWQNQADYELHADLDTAARVLKATETITYTNSPDTLPRLWLQVDPDHVLPDDRSNNDKKAE